MQDFEQRSARREAATQRAFKDIRAVGLSIVKTLNHSHATILERIDRKLGRSGQRTPRARGRRQLHPEVVPAPHSSSSTQYRGSALTKTSSPSAIGSGPPSAR